MSRLLSANFYRLCKNKVFWLELIFTFVFSICICFMNYSPKIQLTENRLYLDDVFFTFYQIIGIVYAAGISMIVGTEYSDGTIRNKVIVGHTRTHIYFANLITSIAVSFLVMLTHTIITGVVGYALFGGFQMPLSQVAFALICSFLVAIVYTSICIFISMNCSNNSATTVLSLLMILALIYMSSYFGSALTEPEMTYNGVTITMDGVQFGDMIKNPAYVSGMQRILYDFLYDLLPSGQLLQLYSQDFSGAVRWPLLSISSIVLITSIGFGTFRRKDIK